MTLGDFRPGSQAVHRPTGVRMHVGAYNAKRGAYWCQWGSFGDPPAPRAAFIAAEDLAGMHTDMQTDASPEKSISGNPTCGGDGRPPVPNMEGERSPPPTDHDGYRPIAPRAE